MSLSENDLNKFPDKEFRGNILNRVNDFKEDADKLICNQTPNEFKEHMNNLGEFQENTSKLLNEIRKSAHDVKIESDKEKEILKKSKLK